ncbi:MAG TPA: methyltransferase domain-containing protein [Methanoregulaceae archaeon]|nr:methyltransferase domain-containing protein [Methanoregulaceae archaeon]HPD75294.1 methyltransferase domain-containing protein [Methanoregulaceae archaeon]
MAERTIASEFRNVDAAQDADALARYLEYVDALPPIRQLKVNTYRYLGLRPGDTVLDAGCGAGFDAIRMAEIVGKNGRVTGIDISEHLLALATKRAAATGLAVTFRSGDVRALPFPDASFDAVRIERTLQIVDKTDRILDEMVRVLRPGGRLVAVEPDWATDVIDPDSHDTGRTFFRFCGEQFVDGSTGRKLYRYFRERGLEDVVIHPEPLVLHDLDLVRKMINMDQFLAASQGKGVLSLDEANAWLSELRDADRNGRLTFAGLLFAVYGRKT